MGYYEFREEMSEEEICSLNVKIFNVGWIDSDHSFTTGSSPIEFVKKLERLIVRSGTYPFQPIVMRCRGQDRCIFCEARNLVLREGDNEEVLGSSDLMIPLTPGENTYFISPTLIYHNIVEHNYLPPPEFISSVLAVDESIEYVGDAIYMTALGLEELYEPY